ncbi:MAG: SRPBCC family protein [Cytophagaceae bacterium]|nr:SRPBCC family protein [Cytophagaceae bacterium]
MKIVKIALLGVLGILGIFLILGLILPKEFNVERSVVINAPKDTVLNQAKSLKNAQQWSPWAELDPNMKVTYTGVDGTVGSASTWEGNDKVGKGKQEILAVTDSQVDIKLNFIEPWESESRAYFKIEPQGNATKTTWGIKGSNPYPFNAFCIFMDMDSMLGKDFEKGLNKLKAICEKK